MGDSPSDIGGFSMGSVTTWYALQYNMAWFRTYLPLCGDSWAMGERASNVYPEQTWQKLHDAVLEQGFDKEDFFVMMLDGTDDISEPMVSSLMYQMEKHSGDVFDMSESGNVIFLLQEGGIHTSDYAKGYLFYVLRTLYAGK